MNKKEIIKVIIDKVNKDSDLTWNEIKRKVELPYSKESIRKMSPGIKLYHEYLQEQGVENATEEQIKELHEKTLELKKVMTQNQDMKTYINRESRRLGRVEHLVACVKDSVDELNKLYPLVNDKDTPMYIDGNIMCILCSDWHIGAEFENVVNKFNVHIAKERINKSIEESVHIGKLNNVKTVNVVGIGDLVNGVIKTMVRIESREDVAQQVTLVSEILSELLHRLSLEFDTIRFYLTSSNHERIFQDKYESTPRDSFHMFIKEFVRLRVQSNNVHVMENRQDESFALIPLGSKVMVASHGDKDKKGASINRYSQILGFTPDYVCLGHHHSSYESVEGKCTVIGNGSLMGSNNYAVDLRLYSKPMQKVLIFNDDGDLKSVNHITF